MRSAEAQSALLEAARKARENAYAPYSQFAVGAAVETGDGTIVTGCNVENASISISICAERVALARAIAEGHRAFRALAVVGPDGVDTPPCGACRQFAAEFAPEMLISYTAAGGLVNSTIGQLLPHAFHARSLRR
jgi:cytidine deaminase